MLILRNIIITILLLVLAGISVVGLMIEAPPIWNFTPDRTNALGRSVLAVLRPGGFLFLCWWLILLGTLLVFFITVGRPRRRMKIEVQMGGGKVVIMDAAIKKYIRNALAEIGEVTVKKIDLRDHRNTVTTDIYADVRTKENLPTLERRIISRVRSALAEDLGITNLGDVHVFIRNFEVTGRPVRKSEPDAGASKSAPEPEPAETKSEVVAPALGAAAVGGATVPEAQEPPVDDAPTAPESEPELHLNEAVEPPGAADPIILEDAEPADDTPPVKPDAFGSSSTILAEKSLQGTTDAHQDEDLDKISGMSDWDPAARPDAPDNDDDKKDPEDRGPLPL